ncbi:AN1-type zinc finger protein 4 isoform X1 [Acipenser ruthenus]|uniref:AN1-type zinc finger protein 4 isoform X1 n=2 Tax=Acipenser ruthenus TaxID=7906 RepID=UPI00274225B8|nr:AN1-type zinc finger protein 4 isoform X1 [Acipenser ruthenus]XP_058891763.1 AN1-type zinc finger protein 4 isoform X1 [Acipenser ruthenus]XP_058891764.1 AN1-type zinc finger protein 4 isoform X1 [Acipenser ruthenus]
MANKKEPPFFNEDNVEPFHYKIPFCETMELFIETLTGTCFELRVSPFETVISVKAKIQRLEGILVAQQNLIWNNVELEDEYCLNDYNISEGSTLKLVLAMRGGPINTRRVPMEDHVKEMTEYTDPTQDEVWDKGPSKKQVTLLVYREGDHLNLFRVVDRGDGTLTPLSESISGGSVYNLYTEEDEESDVSPSSQQIMDNSITMNKMKMLKAKMENMNLSNKHKKPAKVKPSPPVGPCPSSGSLNAVRHRLFRVLPHISQSLNPASCLPPAGDQHPSATAAASSHSALSMLAPPSRALPSSSCYLVKEEETWECPVLPPPPSKIRLPPKVSRVELGSSKLLKNTVLPPVTTLQNREAAETETKIEGAFSHSLREDRALAETCKDAFNLPAENLTDISAAANLEPVDEGLGSTEEAAAPEQSFVLSKAMSSEYMDTGIVTIDQASQTDDKVPLQYMSESASSSLARPQKLPAYGNLRPIVSHSVLKSRDFSGIPGVSPVRTARFQGINVDSPGKLPDIAKTETHDITDMANMTPNEPLAPVNNLGILASLARGTSRDSLQGSCRRSRRYTNGGPLLANLHLFPEDTDSSFMPAHGFSGGASSSVRRVGAPMYHLPPMKAPIQTKKKNSKHCFLCRKKTGLANSYECRCGNNFCATHRYAETHDCTYDYKTAGRRYLQENNPIITAPKLPKI